MTQARLRRAQILGALTLLGVTAALPAAAVPPSPADPLRDPGKSTTNADDTSAIAVNPADLVFLPGAELRWNMIWTGPAAPLPIRGNSLAAGVPIGPFATGLRLDSMSPPSAAPSPFNSSYHWIRWAVALGTEDVSIGSTFGWGMSRAAALDGLFSVTSGITFRPAPWVSLAFVARDWNEPESEIHTLYERSWVWGLGVRPFGSRVFEAGFDLTYRDRSDSWAGRAVLGLDVPRLGRLRGDLTVSPDTD